MNSQSKASAICSDTISSQHGRYTDTTIQSLRNCGRGEKNSVLSMFGHTKEASVLRHWSLFVLFGKNTPNRIASALKYAILIYTMYSSSRLLERAREQQSEYTKGETIVWQ